MVGRFTEPTSPHFDCCFSIFARASGRVHRRNIIAFFGFSPDIFSLVRSTAAAPPSQRLSLVFYRAQIGSSGMPEYPVTLSTYS